MGEANVLRNGAYGYLSLNTTVLLSGAWIWAGSMKSSDPRFGLAPSIARTKVDLTSSASTGWPLTGPTLWNLASVLSLTVHVMASGDSALRPRSPSMSWSAAVSGLGPVLKAKIRL